MSEWFAVRVGGSWLTQTMLGSPLTTTSNLERARMYDVSAFDVAHLDAEESGGRVVLVERVEPCVCGHRHVSHPVRGSAEHRWIVEDQPTCRRCGMVRHGWGHDRMLAR